MRRLCLVVILSLCLFNITKAQLISIVDSTNRYPTIEKILKLDYFKNKVVYVDIWGTRCGPCLSEFKWLPDLKSKYQNDSIVFLYLCSPYQMKWIDNKENVKLWESLLSKHHLSGINIFMSVESYMDLFNNHDGSYSEDRKFGIPTYLLVDKKNNIVDFDAPRPSENEVLTHSIDLLLNNSSLKGDSTYTAFKLKKADKKREESNVGRHLEKFIKKDLFGAVINSDSLKTKYLLVDFSSVTCAPCMREISVLNSISDSLENIGVTIISFYKENGVAVKNALRKKIPSLSKLSYTVIPNSVDLFDNYFINSFPTHLFVDKNGEIKSVIKGGPSEKEGGKEFLNEILLDLSKLEAK